jgi:hypothetical protein
VYLVLLILGVSYNQPKLCPTATWNQVAKTLATGGLTIKEPNGIFVNSGNNIYVSDRGAPSTGVSLWLDDGATPTTVASTPSLSPRSIFVTMTKDIYIDTANPNYRVAKWSSDTNTIYSVMSTDSLCYGLFIDINDKLYCSLYNGHQVVTQEVIDGKEEEGIAAGTGSKGSDSYTLFSPSGIFVDINFDLYVADSGNNRIQLFLSGQMSAVTIAGSTTSLKYPTGVVLDADKYLFIVDSDNHRIVRSGPNGFQCIIGCSGRGSSSDQLDSPMSLSFDSFGNIFVTDYRNARIQKFLLSTSLCGK